MKKYLIIVLCLCLGLGAAQAERSVAPYTYVLEEGGSDYQENLIFNADVIIIGENARMVFSNCQFNGAVILRAQEGTRVMLLGCEVKGSCVIENQVTEASMEYNNPKFMTDGPVNVVCEGGAGSLIALGDFKVGFNGESYSMASSTLFGDTTHPETGYVPYTGQEASYYLVAYWLEGGAPTTLVLCEYDPTL